MMQLALNWTPTPKYHRHDPDTSRLAAKRLGGLAAVHHRIILDACHQELGGLTGEEIADRTGLSMVQVMRRMNELVRCGKVRDLGIRRANRSGRLAVVWGTR
jgi:response regulator of citrate/malate metabolism